MAAARPRLRQDLRFFEQESDGKAIWLVKDPVARKYFRFGPLEAWIMQQMDGSATLQEIAEALHQETGLRTTAEQIGAMARRLREIGLIERSAEERSAMLMEQLRSQRLERRRLSEGTLLRMRFSFGDPDRLLTACVARMPWFWTPGFVAFSLFLFAVYGAVLLLFWGEFSHAVGMIYSPASLTLGFAIATWLAIFALFMVHELGHGLTCKRFGGEVREIGAMLLYFMPAFFCNVNDAWSFEKRSHRLWVSFAGGWIQLVAATLAAIVWLVTEPGTLVNGLALFIAAVGGGLTLLVNYNPLIPLDGYYALLDWLEIPNLRARSLQYSGAVVKRALLRLDVPVPPVTDRERRIFLAYGISAAVYSTLLLGFVAWLAGGFLAGVWGAWGFALAVVGLLLLTAGPRAALLRGFRVWRAEKRPGGHMRRAAPMVAAVLLVLAGFAAVVPWTRRATSVVELEAARRHVLRAPADARIERVSAADGALVLAADTLMLLDDPALRRRIMETQARIQAMERSAAAARAAGDAATAAIRDAALHADTGLLNMLGLRAAALVITAPEPGVFVAPRVHERLGEPLLAGDHLAQVWAHGPLRGRLRLPQQDAGTLQPGATVRARFNAANGGSLRGRLSAIEPQTEAGFVEVIVEFDNLPPDLRAGMRGRARVDLQHVTLAAAAIRAARRIVRLELLL
jgi:putative peptide zinc metalloprotease protein